MTRRGWILLLALLLDATAGDPPNRLHPVAWMGSLIARLYRLRPQESPPAELTYGAAVVLGGSGLVAVVGGLFSRLAAHLPAPLAVLAEALLLKATFSGRGLWRAAGEIELALSQGELGEARRLLAWHLVSRDTAQLTAGQVAAATIESVAENSSDSLAAPLLAYGIGGLPLALAYRFTNTADAMWGYRDPAREWLGKAPARLDDLANFAPARLTAVLITITAQIIERRGRRAWQVMRRDGAGTASPNAGYPMAAMAGALGVSLEKVGHYTLGKGLGSPQSGDIARARRVLLLVAGLMSSLLLLWFRLQKGVADE